MSNTRETTTEQDGDERHAALRSVWNAKINGELD